MAKDFNNVMESLSKRVSIFSSRCPSEHLEQRVGVVDAGLAVAQALDQPTAGNWVKAGIKIGLAGLEIAGRLNPATGIILGIMDLTGLTDKLFEW